MRKSTGDGRPRVQVEVVPMISCLSPGLKRILGEELSRSGAVEELLAELEGIPACPGGVPIGFARGKGRRTARQPSEYQQFISKCMKEKRIRSFGEAPAAMRECAAEWRRLRGGRG